MPPLNETFGRTVTGFRRLGKRVAIGLSGDYWLVIHFQRIRYANNETNYCPACQTGGKLLAERALSRLLKKDWPRIVDELEKTQTRVRKAG